MTKPNRLPACQHVQIGAQLQEIRNYLLHLSVDLGNTYPKASQQARAAERAQRAVDDLRNVLDSVSAGELPGDAWAPAIYYRANDDMRRVDIDRVLRIHQADNPPCCADDGRR